MSTWCTMRTINKNMDMSQEVPGPVCSPLEADAMPKIMLAKILAWTTEDRLEDKLCD